MYSRTTPTPSPTAPASLFAAASPAVATALTAIAFAIGAALFLSSRAGLSGNALVLAGVVALIITLPLSWFFPRWRAPLAATAAFFLAGHVALPVTRWLLGLVPTASPLRYWLVSGPGNGILGQLPAVLVMLLAGRYIFGLSLREQWSGSLRFTRGSWRYGTVAALFLTVVTIGLAAAVGQGNLYWHFVPAEFGVNAFSNLWEEIRARGLVLVVVRQAFGDRAAYLWTAVLFGLMHGFGAQGYFIIAVSWVMAWAIVRGRTLWGGWFAHQLSDLLIDSLLH